MLAQIQLQDAALQKARHELEGRVRALQHEIAERERAERELEIAHRDLVVASRRAGMAEVAKGVLHNVGNVLNSVNVSTLLLRDAARKSEITTAVRLAELMRGHEKDLKEFLTVNPRGREVPPLLLSLAGPLQAEQETLLVELELLTKNVEHIKHIVAMQQSYASVAGVLEHTEANTLVKDALEINAAALVRHGVEVVCDFNPVPRLLLDKHKVLQALVNLNPSIHDDIRKILASAQTRHPGLERAKAAVLGESLNLPQGISFVVHSALQGAQGLEMVQRALKAGQPYALAFVDMRMPPGWDGVTTLTELWKTDPNLQVIICTAYSDYSWDEIVHRIGRSANMVIPKKPFDNIEVFQLTHALAEKWRLNDQLQARLADLDQLVRQRTAELEDANAQLRREITERAAVEQALRQAQKIEAICQLAAGVAHDFNNILTVIEGHVSLLVESIHTPDAEESIREIRDSANRAASLVRQLLAFSRKQVIQPSPLDLGHVMTSVGTVLSRVLGEHITLQIHPASGLPPIEAGLRMIEQIIINLAINARDAIPNGGSLFALMTLRPAANCLCKSRSLAEPKQF